MPLVTSCLVSLLLLAEPLGSGLHSRQLTVSGLKRTYLAHVPPSYDATHPTPLVLVLHAAGTNAAQAMRMTGLNDKADQAGFIAVYPNGTGLFASFDAGGRSGRIAETSVDDVGFVAALLEELPTHWHIDPQRVFATGISNGGMMCYRLAAELSDRIAAIAPVAGTMAIEEAHPTRPVPILHFHGTADTIVPPTGPNLMTPKFLTFKSLAETLAIWRRINGCPEQPVITELPDLARDGTRVKQYRYGPGPTGAEVILLEIEGGGHTWPGRSSLAGLLGRSTRDISANDLIWNFFQRHPLE